MFRIARWHTAFGLVFAILGMLLGIVMASTHNHTQHVTHAHILLLGFATSLLYGLVLRAWVPDEGPALTLALARVQVALHQVGTVVVVAGLFLLYGGSVPEPSLGPVLGIGSIAALLGAVLMLVVYLRATRSRSSTRAAWPSAQQPL